MDRSFLFLLLIRLTGDAEEETPVPFLQLPSPFPYASCPFNAYIPKTKISCSYLFDRLNFPGSTYTAVVHCRPRPRHWPLVQKQLSFIVFLSTLLSLNIPPGYPISRLESVGPIVRPLLVIPDLQRNGQGAYPRESTTLTVARPVYVHVPTL